MPRKICRWSEIEPDSGIYNTCQEGEEFHLTPGLELYEFCMWCGGRIVVTVELPENESMPALGKFAATGEDK